MTGINFKLLEVDLDTGKNRVLDVTDDVGKFLGGSGLGAKLVWDLVPPGADPLGPQNILHVGVGPAVQIAAAAAVDALQLPQRRAQREP